LQPRTTAAFAHGASTGSALQPIGFAATPTIDPWAEPRKLIRLLLAYPTLAQDLTTKGPASQFIVTFMVTQVTLFGDVRHPRLAGRPDLITPVQDRGAHPSYPEKGDLSKTPGN
jgi:hypothetical protein